MVQPLTIALVRASLPSYFPDRHGVWARAEAALDAVCAATGARLLVAGAIPQDGRTAARALDWCQAEGADLVLVLHGGFTMGDVSRAFAAGSLPVGFWAVPEPVLTGDIQLNGFVSLNMSLSIARGVRDLRAQPVAWYHGAPADPALRLRLARTLRALKARKALRGASVGVVGGLAPTFYNLAVDQGELLARLGVSVASHDMAELTGRMRGCRDAEVEAERDVMERAATVRGVSPEQMDVTARAALALQALAREAGHDALAVSDWPALQSDPGMHPGAAFSWIEERDNLPVASEGDVLGAVTQLALRALTGRVGCLLDMTEPDTGSGQLLVWHGGGGPLYLADARGAAWINHPMIGRGTPEGPRHGAIADLVFAPGPATVARIARHGGALFRMGATVVSRDPAGFAGSRGWLRDFTVAGEPASLGDVVATVMAHGLDHHFVLVPGDHGADLAEFGAWCGMAALTRRPARDHLEAADFT